MGGINYSKGDNDFSMHDCFAYDMSGKTKEDLIKNNKFVYIDIRIGEKRIKNVKVKSERLCDIIKGIKEWNYRISDEKMSKFIWEYFNYYKIDVLITPKLRLWCNDISKYEDIDYYFSGDIFDDDIKISTKPKVYKINNDEELYWLSKRFFDVWTNDKLKEV